MSILRIGHRGCAYRCSENTPDAFETAITEFDVDMVECDVHQCKGERGRSGELVVIHDSTLDRTTDGTGPVREHTLSEIKRLVCKGGDAIPTLEETLDVINRRARVNIELKSSDTEIAVHKVLTRRFFRDWSPDDFLISAKPVFYSQLETLRRLCPVLPIGVLYTKQHAKSLAFANKINAESLHPNMQFLTLPAIDAIHRERRQIYVWTVNLPQDIRRVAAMGVDGIFSDFPDRLPVPKDIDVPALSLYNGE